MATELVELGEACVSGKSLPSANCASHAVLTHVRLCCASAGSEPSAPARLALPPLVPTTDREASNGKAQAINMPNFQ